MVSVIIPTYNRANVLGRSIKSVLNQSYQDFELIIVDDGSTDNTCRLVDTFNDPRIRYLRNNQRLGANGARNIGIQNSKGDYIAFQDSDDVWRSDKLEKQVNMFHEMEDIDIIYSRYMRHWQNGKNELVPNKNYTKNMLQEEIAHTLAESNVIGTPTMIARKKCFCECGMFDLELKRFQDWEINIVFVQHYKYGFIDDMLVDAYESDDSISNISNIMDSIASIVKKHQKFFEAQGTIDMQFTMLAYLAMDEKKLKDLQEILGETLFFRSIYSYCENYSRRLEVIKKNYNFMKEWISRGKNNYIVNSFLHKYEDNSIALYGLGDIGKLFLNVLTGENKKKVKYVIDRKISSYNKYMILSPKVLTDKELGGIKCIIIAAVAYEDEIRRELELLTTIPIISVYDVISEI